MMRLKRSIIRGRLCNFLGLLGGSAGMWLLFGRQPSRIRESSPSPPMPLARPNMKRWPLSSAAVAILVSVAALATSAANLYFAQLRVISRLSARVSDMQLNEDNVEQKGAPTDFRFQAKLTLALINTGNVPASLLKVFLAFRQDFGKLPCAPVRQAATRSYITNSFGGEPTFNAQAFGIASQVIPPNSIAIVKGTLLQPVFIARFDESNQSNYGKEADACLVFVAMDADGRLYVQAVPAAKVVLIRVGFASGLSDELGKPIRLIGKVETRMTPTGR